MSVEQRVCQFLVSLHVNWMKHFCR